MANQQRTAGFMEQLGLMQPPPNNRVGGSDRHSSIVNSVRAARSGGAAQLAAGAIGGVAAQFGGDKGGFKDRMKAFGEGANVARQALMDGEQAREQGVPVQEIINKRLLAQQIQSVKMGDTPESQLNGWKRIAQMADDLGLGMVSAQAIQHQMALTKQIDDRRKAGIEMDEAELEIGQLQDEVSLGYEANLVTDDPDSDKGKAVRIDRARAEEMGLPPESVGKWLYVGPDGNQQVVDPVAIRLGESMIDKYGRGGIRPQDDNILALAKANGATPGNIPKMRGVLSDMNAQAGIVTEVAGMFMELQDPEFMLDLTGKSAIQVNRWVRFGENAAQIITAADGGAAAHADLIKQKYTWNEEEVGGPEAQHSKWMQFAEQDNGQQLVSTLNKLSKEAGLPGGSTLQDFLPGDVMQRLVDLGAGTAQIARYAEQYWANVMELAYMDARLKEPSNRGLSDKDIENALRRIGAATASPASFAQRQLSLIRRVGDAIDALGEDITIPYGSKVRRNDLIDFIYRPEVRYKARDAVDVAEQALQEVYDKGIRSEPLAAQPAAPAATRIPATSIPGYAEMAPADQQEFAKMWDALTPEQQAQRLGN